MIMKNRLLLSILSVTLFLANVSYPAVCGAQTSARVLARVLYVIDGDTIKVLHNNNKESVRLIGIDTPESRNNRRAVLQAQDMDKTTNEIVQMGRTAKRHAQSLVRKGSLVSLEFDAQQRDRYGRLLAYVYLPDGRMLNAEIIKNGFAMPLTVPPSVKYSKMFVELYRQARQEKKGLWRE